MSNFWYPPMTKGHPSLLAWVFLWWLLIPVYVIWLVGLVGCWLFIVPLVNLVRLLTRRASV